MALIWIAAACAPWQHAAAQSLGPERQDLNNLRGDIWATITSPVHPNRRAAAPTAAAAVGLAALGAFADSSLYHWMSTHPNALVVHALFPIREEWKLPLYELGSGQYLLPISGALYIAGRQSHRVDLRDAGLGCAAAHLSSASLRDVIYLLVSRERPRITPSPEQIAIPGSKNWDNHSFLSGHVANSMGCASFLAHRFSLGLLEPAMYAYVSAIGLGRLVDGRHWASDTMAGALMGFAIGKEIADRQMHRLANAPGTAAVAARGRRVPVVSWTIEF